MAKNDKEVFLLFVKHYKSYETLINNSCNKYLKKIIDKLGGCSNDEKRLEYLLNETMSITESCFKCSTLLEENKIKFFTYKNFVSKVINLEYNEICKKWNSTHPESQVEIPTIDLKAIKEDIHGYDKIVNMELSEFERPDIQKLNDEIKNNLPKFPKWQSNVKAKEHYICPYCNAEYLFRGNGYAELDHIYSRHHYPALTYMPLNWLKSCRSCNNKKSDSDIEFSLDDILMLHQGKFASEKFKFKKNIGDRELMEKLASEITNNSALKANVEASKNKLDQIVTYFIFEFVDDNLNNLKIHEKYQSVYKILMHMYNRFDSRKMELKKLADSHIGLSEKEFVDKMIGEDFFKDYFDDWTSEDREEMEVLFYWRRAYLKFLLLSLREEMESS